MNGPWPHSARIAGAHQDSAASSDRRCCQYLAAVGVLLAAIRGETALDDDAIYHLIAAEPDDGSKKRLALGLKTAGLIGSEHVAAAFGVFQLREA